MKTAMKHEESKETPAMESKSHSPAFLKKAVKDAEKKGAGKKAFGKK